jgi:hypothetical protein
MDRDTTTRTGARTPGVRRLGRLNGGAKLSSRQIYTQVSIRMLKQVHSMTHPAHLQKPAVATGDGNHTSSVFVLFTKAAACLQCRHECTASWIYG